MNELAQIFYTGFAQVFLVNANTCLIFKITTN